MDELKSEIDKAIQVSQKQLERDEIYPGEHQHHIEQIELLKKIHSYL